MVHSTRAAGWKHAKLSGHKNEELVKTLLCDNTTYSDDFLTRLSLDNSNIVSVSVGGLYEKMVDSVNGNKTKSKTDLIVHLYPYKQLNMSIKKSQTGQVYFIKADAFIETFQRQFNTQIPLDVVRALSLFWSQAADAADIISLYADSSNPRYYNLQLRHNSVNALTLKSYSVKLYTSLLNWFIENSYELAMLSFSMGAVKDSVQWSDYIWYINRLGENDIDDIFSIGDICKFSQLAAPTSTFFSVVNGGTTIRLPFGFVQWHQGKMQFHHDYYKILNLFR